MEPYYPVNNEKNQMLYQKYREKAQQQEKVFFGGRLGEYKYYDMDAVIAAAQKNLNLSRRIFHTSSKTIRGRLLSYLSYQAMEREKEEFDIPYNRQQLADYLGVDRSAMSNELGKMQKDGLIEVKRNHFRILDVD